MSHSPTTATWHTSSTAQPSLKTGAAASTALSKPAKSKASKNPHGVGTARSYMSPSNDRTKTAQPPTNHRPSTTQVPTKYNRKLPQPRPKFAPSSPQVRQLVELMGKGDYTIKELTELCGFIDPKHFREGYIKPALRENAIEILYADRPNHPKQKYRLTVVAKEWKEFNFKS